MLWIVPSLPHRSSSAQDSSLRSSLHVAGSLSDGRAAYGFTSWISHTIMDKSDLDAARLPGAHAWWLLCNHKTLETPPHLCRCINVQCMTEDPKPCKGRGAT